MSSEPDREPPSTRASNNDAEDDDRSDIGTEATGDGEVQILDE